MDQDGDNPRGSAIPDDTLVLLNRATLVQHTVRTAVHELNNVLQMIAGSAELLGSAALPATAAARVETILKHSSRGHTLVQSVGELARAAPPAARTVDLGSLCDQALSLRRYEHKRAAITATLERPPAGTALVRADGSLILQAILNLIVNAEQSLASVPNGAIMIAVSATGGQVEVIVSDTGAGPTDRHAIFEPLITTRAPAAGLGLAASRLIARQWGGEVEALDGARFRLALPAIAPAR
jgi:signal transduction histidine kinase